MGVIPAGLTDSAAARGETGPLAYDGVPARPSLSQSVRALATLVRVREPEDMDRPGFVIARPAASALHPAIQRAAARLWRGDRGCAERRYWLRSG